MEMSLYLRACAVSGFVIALSAPVASAETIFAYRIGNQRLVSFDSATPGTLISDVPLTLPNGDAFLFGIDFNPIDGLLYGRSGVGNGLNASTVLIDTTTGVATAIGGTSLSGVDGGIFSGLSGVDFDPVTNSMRVVRHLGSNRQYDPTDGTLTSTDTDLAYGAGDPNAGAVPNVVNAAYSNNVAGAVTTTLYGIDDTLGALVRIGGTNGAPSPNGGILTTIGVLGLSLPPGLGFIGGGFDISGASGVAYAQFRLSNTAGQVSGQSGLYTIDLNTGAATFVGVIGNVNNAYDGLAVAPSAAGVPEPSTFAMIGLGAMLAAGLRMRRR
jgi:hypothetical protein